jgi:hypothetical protein
MSGKSESAAGESDDDLFEGWFEQGELVAVSEAGPYDEISDRRPRVAMVIAAAISATALTLVVLLAGHA